ncbi:aminotransferase class V-fold PLP-dependent enzyme [Glaciecola siphonariae]|uniref:cysteine desulfurase n=1 Tax=Glaciecola siphonariae TaxID=521012 RepID=A0ABV9LTK8_9ALTE
MTDKQNAPSLRSCFDFFDNNNQHLCTYLDSAASTQKLSAALDYTDAFARHQYASVHRSAYTIASAATARYEEARKSLARFINANSDDIVFTSGATESINMIAKGLSQSMLNGSTILIVQSEHHANILPWQALAEAFSLNIKVLPLAENGVFNEQTHAHWLNEINDDVAILACAHVSNVLGNIYPVASLCKKAQEHNAISVIDGTQAVAHIKTDVAALHCDFYVFSGHKMYGPTGIGVCWGRAVMLEKLRPSKLGGEMVQAVSFEAYTAVAPPLKFEAGTPNIMGALGLAQACDFLAQHLHDIERQEAALYRHLCHKMQAIHEITMLGNESASIGIVSFYAPNADNHSLALKLYQKGIALRFGQHCAMPLLSSMGISACLRVSLGCYNNREDVDTFVSALKEALADSAEDSIEDKQYIDARSDLKTVHADSVATAIKSASGWPQKHRQLLLISQQLPLLSEPQRNENNEVHGCEARVWIAKDQQTNAVLAYGDSKVVRGLLTLMLHKYASDKQQGRASKASDYLKFLDDIGLSDYFSSGRKDGMTRVAERLGQLT